LRNSERAAIKTIALVEVSPSRLCYVTRTGSTGKASYFKDRLVFDLLMVEAETELEKRGYEIIQKKKKREADCILSFKINNYRARMGSPVKFSGFSGNSKIVIGISNVRVHASLLLAAKIPTRKAPRSVYNHLWIKTKVIAQHNYWKLYSKEEQNELIMELVDLTIPKVAPLLDKMGLKGPFELPKVQKAKPDTEAKPDMEAKPDTESKPDAKPQGRERSKKKVPRQRRGGRRR